ncbi:uncharacterized protein [Prorops nasuta]|uniref:uncharacterized protein n=1 Tax=Prorops nasuta TaxID=863751 RepID=UPI0034CE49AB
MQRFWEVEEVATVKQRTEEESECEKHFVNTVGRDKHGRYIVRLPFRKDAIKFSGSRDVALRRFKALERRFANNETFEKAYKKVFDEYLELGHMSVIKNNDDTGYYMPHHPVYKESSNTTKLRIVFDASAKDMNGQSLNDLLMVGPTIQDRLISHLMRFRMYKYIITADIEKMYRQVLVHENDRKYQQVLWRHNGNIQTFCLNTLTFGVSSSAFLAIRAINRLAEDEGEQFPRAAEILKTHLYVDDLLTGANTIEEARDTRDVIIKLLSRGRFTIRQWAANDLRIIEDLPYSSIHTNFVLNLDNKLKTLGITLNATSDNICYTPNCIKIDGKITKRLVLSEIAKIFDPLGLLSPIILHLKHMMQTIWQAGLDWDESLPQDIHTGWMRFVDQWGLMGPVLFDRKLLINECQKFQLHGFCDASNIGYGACVYVRS